MLRCVRLLKGEKLLPSRSSTFGTRSRSHLCTSPNPFGNRIVSGFGRTGTRTRARPSPRPRRAVGGGKTMRRYAWLRLRLARPPLFAHQIHWMYAADHLQNLRGGCARRNPAQHGDGTMKTITYALAFLMVAATIAQAQPARNFSPAKSSATKVGQNCTTTCYPYMHTCSTNCN
jgi:hypothetical protein